MRHTNKYIYLWVIQCFTDSYGWEDECEYDKKETTYKQVLADLREYRLLGYRYRLIERRKLAE